MVFKQLLKKEKNTLVSAKANFSNMLNYVPVGQASKYIQKRVAFRLFHQIYSKEIITVSIFILSSNIGF
jgi:hypothetical protein